MKKFVCLLLALIMLLPCVCLAEEANDPYALPTDISFPNYKADPNGFTETSYHDDSLDITMEVVNWQGTVFHVAHIKVASPTQLRTAVAGKPNVPAEVKPSVMAAKMNAVLAINGEFYTQRTRDIFIYRQGIMFRNEPDPDKDILIIDSKGDFHIFIGNNKAQEIADFTAAGNVIMQAFSFGPALVSEGKRVGTRNDYPFKPNERNWRTVIGQEGPLSYVCILSEGSLHKELAEFCMSLGLQAAYNLDGGQSSTMVFGGTFIGGKNRENTEREQSDIIYFVTAVPDN